MDLKLPNISTYILIKNWWIPFIDTIRIILYTSKSHIHSKILKEILVLNKIKETCVKNHFVDAIYTCKLSHYFCKDLHILTVRQTCPNSLRMHRKNDRNSHTHRLSYKQIYHLHNLNFFFTSVICFCFQLMYFFLLIKRIRKKLTGTI